MLLRIWGTLQLFYSLVRVTNDNCQLICLAFAGWLGFFLFVCFFVLFFFWFLLLFFCLFVFFCFFFFFFTQLNSTVKGLHHYIDIGLLKQHWYTNNINDNSKFLVFYSQFQPRMTESLMLTNCYLPLSFPHLCGMHV